MSFPKNRLEFIKQAGLSQPGSLEPICVAIDTYYQNKCVDYLYIIFKEAEHWLKDHESSTKSNPVKYQAVWDLKQDVYKELDIAEQGLGAALHDYTFRKTPTTGKGFTSLQKGYDLERKMYVDKANYKKGVPFSASDVRDYALPQGRNLSDLSTEEFLTLGKQNRKVAQMYFLNKIQRLRLLAKFTDKGWKDISGNLRSTKIISTTQGLGGVLNCQMYAMDRYGQVFVDYDNIGHAYHNLGGGTQKVAIKNRGQTNHSSFCAGREVICAGMIFFWKGQLIHIDNYSGHYGSNRPALRQAVQILVEEGANQRFLRVGLFGVGLFTAEGFLRNAHAPDWCLISGLESDDQTTNQDSVFTSRGVLL